MKYVTIGSRSLKIAYQDLGEGAPLLLLHGFCGSSGYWEKLAPLLAEHYRLIIPDLPGHGQSTIPEEPSSIEAYADVMLQLLDEIGVDQAVWLGHSFGGYITLAAAERFANRLVAFGLIHSTAYPDDEKAKGNRLNGISAIEEKGIRPFIDNLVPKLFAPAHLDNMPEAVEQARSIGYHTTPEGAIRALHAMRNRPDRNHVLKTAELPVLLVAGENDQIITPEKVFSSNNELQSRVLLDAAGHMSMMETTELLAASINRFLKK